MARCEDCIHYGVYAELENFRDPLWFINTKDEFCCSWYLHADVVPRAEFAREIFEEIEQTCRVCSAFGVRGYIMDDVAELKKKYTKGKR